MVRWAGSQALGFGEECKRPERAIARGERDGRRRRARDERAIDRPMTVGKFSMGGISN